MHRERISENSISISHNTLHNKTFDQINMIKVIHQHLCRHIEKHTKVHNDKHIKIV